MDNSGKTYVAIDLKSFYASVECVERGLDPLKTNLVVADASRTEKTICLAVSPSLKAIGIPGRPRLFEVVEKVRSANALRLMNSPSRKLERASTNADALAKDSTLSIDYITATPRMATYMRYSTRIYGIYLKYIAPEDIHVYSVDEVFIDVTGYLRTYSLSARELTEKLISEVLRETGITATAGIGTNLYLAKVAMDVVAKRVAADKNGVRIAELDEASYRRLLWEHKPLTDFWRVGRGYARKLETHGLYTMGDIARCSLGDDTAFHNEALLYKLFGVNAELLIDHAWGYEPCEMSDIKAYKPSASSMSSGQVLSRPYSYRETRLIIREMAEHLSLDLVEKAVLTDQLVLNIGYDIENLTDPERAKLYHGEITSDAYGRSVPKAAHGTATLPRATSSTRLITDAVMDLYERIYDKNLLSRRMTLAACRLIEAGEAAEAKSAEQLDLFTDYEALEREREEEKARLEREAKMQKAMLAIKSKFGRNAILKGVSLKEGATAIERNDEIGGHKA